MPPTCCGSTKPRGVDQCRDMVFFERDFRAARARCAVVGRDEENRIGEPGLFRRFGEEPPQCIVGIHHASVARLGVVRYADLPGRVGERAVVAHRHDMCEERLAVAGVFVERADDLAVGVFVAYAPDVGEGDLPGLVLPLVDDLIAVAREEGLHIVEIAVAAVKIFHGVTLVAQQGAGRMHPRIVRALDDALSRAGRQRKRHGLQPAYRAVTRGIDAVERQAPVVERVEHGRQLPGVAEMPHERGAHALDRYQYDVAPYLGALAADGMQVVARAAVHTVYELLGLGFGLGDVELIRSRVRS